MKKFILFLTIYISTFVYVHASSSENFSQTLTSDCLTVTLSTTPSKPTQILTFMSLANPAQSTWIVNPSTFNIFIASANINISTGTSFAIPGTGATTNPPVLWSPDGSQAPYTGALWAVSETTQSPPKIRIFRSR